MHIDVSRAHVHAKTQRLVLVLVPVGDRMDADVGKWDWCERACTAHGTQRNWERDRQEHFKSWWYQLDLSSKNLFRHEQHRVTGMTYDDDFVLERLAEFEKPNCRGVFNQNKCHQSRVNAEHQDIEQKLTLEKAVQIPAVHDVTDDDSEPLD